MASNGHSRRATAQGIAALSIGGMIVTRTLVDRPLADELRTACTAVALSLGGWGRNRKARNGKSKQIPTVAKDGRLGSPANEIP